MGFFGKSVADDEWLNQAQPLYQAALPLTTALNEAINDNGSIEDEYKAVSDAIEKLPAIANAISNLPKPTSSEARRANKNLKSAIKVYTQAIKHGVKFFKDLYGGPGQRLSWGGISERAAASRLVFSKGIYTSYIEIAQKEMAEAATYFSNR